MGMGSRKNETSSSSGKTEVDDNEQRQKDNCNECYEAEFIDEDDSNRNKSSSSDGHNEYYRGSDSDKRDWHNYSSASSGSDSQNDLMTAISQRFGIPPGDIDNLKEVVLSKGVQTVKKIGVANSGLIAGLGIATVSCVALLFSSSKNKANK